MGCHERCCNIAGVVHAIVEFIIREESRAGLTVPSEVNYHIPCWLGKVKTQQYKYMENFFAITIILMAHRDGNATCPDVRSAEVESDVPCEPTTTKAYSKCLYSKCNLQHNTLDVQYVQHQAFGAYIYDN